MLDDTRKAVEAAMKVFKDKCGRGIENGDMQVFALTNCTLIVSLDDGCFKEEFIPGRLLEVGLEVGLYKEDI